MALDIKAPYSFAEAYLYDRAVAPAVAKMVIPELVSDVLDTIPRNGKLLDVGSGGGQVCLELAKHRPDIEIVGIDLSHYLVEQAQKRSASGGGVVEFKQGSVEALPFADSLFDAVISVSSVKHWPDPERGLNECVRVLKSSGKLYVVEIDRGCRYQDARSFVDQCQIPRLLRSWTLQQFRTFVAGQSLDLDDAREIMSSLPLISASVGRMHGTPGLVMQGVR